MMYRTVTVSPEMMYRTVTVSPKITGGIINITPSISEGIDVETEVYTSVRSYGEDADFYDGSYSVTPKTHEQTVLETEGLILRENVVVLEIPYYETSNVKDGYTVYIGSEV